MPDGTTEASKISLSNPGGLQIPTKKEFKPTKKMVKWMLTTFELGFEASGREIQEASGVGRDNWYSWINKDGFLNWWDDQWQQVLKKSRWQLDAIGLKEAKKSYSYWKDMMNRTGNTIPEPGAIGQQINQQFNLANANLERITTDDKR